MAVLLEIAIDTFDDGIAALSAGADRLEVCDRLDLGGLTPPESLVRELRERTEDPLFIMVRPRGEDFVYSPPEYAAMLKTIDDAKSWDIDGIVTGVLTRDNAVDLPRTREIVEHARPLHVTFHRAFDRTHDLDRSLDELKNAGVKRILTSGGTNSAMEGLVALHRLVQRAGKDLEIMPGGGVRPSNIRSILDRTKAREIHSAARDQHGTFQSDIVRTLKDLVESARAPGDMH